MISNSKNSIWLGSQYTTQLILSFVNLKLNLLTFNEKIFSIWILLLSVWNLGGALDLGFGMSTVRFVSRYKNDKNKITKIISTSFFLFIILGIFIFGTTFTLGRIFYLSNRNLIPVEYLLLSKRVFMIMGINFYFLYLNIFFRSVFEGHSRFITVVKINLTTNISIFLSTLIVFFTKSSLINLAHLYLLTSVIQTIFYSLTFYNIFNNKYLKLSSISFSTFKEIFKFSISVQITYLIGALIDPIAKYFIGNYSQKPLIPIYEIARRFSLAVSGLFSFTFKYSFAKTSTLTTNSSYKEYLYNEGIKISNLGITFSAFMYGVLSPIFYLIFHYFYKYDDSLTLFLILALAEAINNTGFILYVFITGTGGVRYLTILQLLNVTINSLSILIGFKFFNSAYGIMGYFFSVLLGNYLMMIYIRNKTAIKILDYYKTSQNYRILYLCVIIISNIFLIHFEILGALKAQVIFSLIILTIFFKEFKKFTIQIFIPIFNRIQNKQVF